MAVDVWISPEQLVTEYVARLIRYPGALQVLDFADGRVRLVGIRALQGGPLVGQALSTLREHIPTADARVAAIYRAGKSVKPEGTTVIEDGDEVFFLAARENIRVVMKEMRREEAPARRVVIAGGGNIGLRLANDLEGQNQVKLIERDGKRARRVSELLKSTTVLHGDAADEELLLEENIDSADVFAALTNSEEANILSAMLAKRLGAHKVMALINKPSYAELIESGSIDVAISPQTVTIGSLLAHVRRGDVVRVHSLRRGAAEALEVVVHGDADSSKVIGRRIEDIVPARRHDLGRGGPRRGCHHRASRHHGAARRSLDPVPDRSAPYRCRRKTVSRLRFLSVKDTLLPVAHVFALVMMVFSVTMLAPLVMAVWQLDPALWAFVISAVATFVLGALLWLATRAFKRELKTRDGLMLVALTWVALPAVAGFPLWSYLPINFTDAYFEAASGLTTTGGTVLSGLEFLPRSINLWRHLLSWLGGMGIIVLAVAILPMLGVGGMQIYRAEMPGPMKDSKLTPRIGQTAKLLWTVYAGLTAACIVSLRFAGMDWFDAVCHGFSALSLGGFSTYDASIGHFNSLPIEMVLTAVHRARGVEFRDSLSRVEPARRAGVFSRRRGQGDLGRARRQLHRRGVVPVVEGQLQQLPHGAALHHLQSGVDRHRQRAAYPGLFALADIRADVDDVLELHRRKLRIHRRRHQNDPHAGARQAGASRTQSAGASEHGAAAQGGRNHHCQPGGIRRAGVRVPVFHEHRHADFPAAGERPGFHDLLFVHHRLHQQRGSWLGAGGPRQQLRGPERFSDLGVFSSHAAWATGGFHHLGAIYSHFVAKIDDLACPKSPQSRCIGQKVESRWP